MRPTLLLAFLFACTGTAETDETDASDSESDAPSDTDTAVDTSWDPMFDGVAEAAEADLADNEASGVSIAILHDGEVVFAQAFGSGHPDEQVDITDQTLFQIGSTTKMMTSMALLQSVEAGNLSLDDTLAEAYANSEFAYDEDWNDQVQLGHLLTHEGAFMDYLDWSGSEDDADLAGWHEDIFFPYLWLMADPGSFWNYSNPNFDIAGLVVEHHDPGGRFWPDIMVEDLWQPLGMDRTYQRKSEAEADGDYALGVGYRIGPSGNTVWDSVLMDDVPDSAAARPAGAGTWTTPTQMMEIGRLLLDGNEAVLSAAHLDDLTTGQVSMGYGDGSEYGYGLMISEGLYLGEDYYEEPVWDHGGNTLSYTSIFYVLPEQDLAFSILSSGYGTDFSGTAGAIIALLADLGEPTDAPELSQDDKIVAQHVGYYDDPWNVGEMIITACDDTLCVDMPTLEQAVYLGRMLLEVG